MNTAEKIFPKTFGFYVCFDHNIFLIKCFDHNKHGL